jgi:hypothetical protein
MKVTHQVAFIVALVAGTLAASTAQAQQGRGFGFGRSMSSLMTLAANEAVQKDLGVGADVAGKLRTLSEDYRTASRKEFEALGIDFQAINDLPEAERAAKRREVGEKLTAVAAKLDGEFNPKLKEALSADQFKRLRQIQIQAAGIETFIDPDVAKELALTDEQRKKIADLRTEYERKQQDLPRTEGNFQERFAKIRELNAERDNKANELLTAEQKTKLTALKGNAFDVSQLRFGRGRNN